MGVGYWYFPINESLLYFLGDKFISLLLKFILLIVWILLFLGIYRTITIKTSKVYMNVI